MAAILVVDDSATNRALISQVLERDGHRIIEAANGAEALGLVWVDPPDLVLTDILMPRVDGYAIDRALRAWSPSADIPLIFHTAMYTPDEIREVVGSHPHRRVLPKPADIAEISEMVASMLDERPTGHAGMEPRTENGDHEHLDLLNAKLLQKVRELELAARERQRLLGSVVSAQEDERARIAGEIHDDPVQAMTVVAMRIELMGPPSDDPIDRERHEKLLEMVRRAIARLRRVIFQLHPPALEREGLAAAVEAFLSHTVEGPGPTCVVHDRFRHEPSTELRALLYRVVQEALTNAVKHAGATKVEVSLEESDDGFLAIVTDDGRGFAVEDVEASRPGHMGLTAMRQHAELAGGWWRLESGPGGGTTVRAWVPDVTVSEVAG